MKFFNRRVALIVASALIAAAGVLNQCPESTERQGTTTVDAGLDAGE